MHVVLEHTRVFIVQGQVPAHIYISFFVFVLVRAHFLHICVLLIRWSLLGSLSIYKQLL